MVMASSLILLPLSLSLVALFHTYLRSRRLFRLSLRSFGLASSSFIFFGLFPYLIAQLTVADRRASTELQSPRKIEIEREREGN